MQPKDAVPSVQSIAAPAAVTYRWPFLPIVVAAALAIATLAASQSPAPTYSALEASDHLAPLITNGQPVFLIGRRIEPPLAVPGVTGRLAVVPLTIQRCVRNRPVAEQIDVLRTSFAAVHGEPLVVQVLFRSREGRPLLSPPVSLTKTPAAPPEAAAVVVDARPRPAHPAVDSIENPPPKPDFDPRRFSTRPLPRDTGGFVPFAGGDHVVSFDLRTRKIVASPPGMNRLMASSRDRAPGSGHAASTAWQEIDYMIRENYNPLSLVGGYGSFPWRMNVKLFMTFPNNSRYVGSGVLIDSKHVLTCGHCVHDSSLGGWATKIEVVPAYNGDLSASNGREPYGWSTSVQLHSWTGWTQNQNLSHDVAVVDLDRPVGALTGWFGYGYDTRCSWYTTPTWHHASYPAESPYDGDRMYYQYGDFDSCPNGYEARFNRYSYGGESGSGNYAIVNGSRYVYGVLSHGGSSHTDVVRLTSTKFGHVKGILDADRPSGFDLTPLQVTGPARVAAGGTLSSLRFMVHNYSKSSFSGKVAFSVYLSTNDYISTSDTKLGDFSVTSSVAALGNLSIHWGTIGPRIPVSMKPRTYYVGVILTTADANSSNQRTLANDVLKIEVWNSVQLTGSAFNGSATITSTPWILGSSHTIRGTRAPSSKLGALFVGYPASPPLQVLPGCHAYFDPARALAQVPVWTNGSGNWTFYGRIKNDPMFLGQTYALQAAFFPLAQPPHLATTHGVYVTVIR